MNTENPYNFFEDIVCINLDISKDRRKHAEKFFENLNIPGRFFTAKKHINGGKYGCFHSHIQVLKDAYERNLNNILVFEDDFLPTDAYSHEKLKIAIDFMKNNDDWDIFHLGYSFVKYDIQGLSSIFDAKYYSANIIQYNPFLTQALCYNKKAIKTIIDEYEAYIGIIQYDDFISSYLGFKNYCIVPMLFDQNFYFTHNNEACDGFEIILRSIFPLLAFTKLNYRVSWLRYIFDQYHNLTSCIYLFLFSLMLYKTKLLLLHSVKKNIYNL